MAENPIKKEDIIDSSGITAALKEIIGLLNDELNDALKNVTASAAQYKKATQAANATTKEGQETIKLASEAYNQLDKEQKEIIETKKKLTAEEKALIKLQQDEIKYGKIQAGSYKDLTAKLKQLREETIRMSKPTQDNINKIKAYETELKKLDATMGRHQRNVGNYTGALKSMAAGFIGVTALVTGFFRVISNGFKTTIEFEAAMSQVKAISGATAEEFTKLRDSAMKLGSTTQFSAKEVANLQTEYARLGFSAQEILNVTDATISLATATGEDLAQSAIVAGSTMRQFGLASTDMQMIVDVMAQSFNKSNLALESFATSMQYAGPVAKAVGESLQDTTSKLMVLSNAGLEASTSGTSLRNIYIELEKRGLTLQQGLDLIANSENKASAALDLFGKRGAVAGLILADNQKLADEFRISLNDVNGVAEETATIMQDNVASAAKKLTGAWQGLWIRTNDSNGSLKGFLDTLTNVITAINTKGKPAIDSLFDERKIDSFNDKWKFFSDQGIGFFETLTSSVFRSKKTTQEWADELAAIGEKEKIKTAETDKIKADAAAKDKERNDAALKAANDAVAAEEAKAEAVKKAADERAKIEAAAQKQRESEVESALKSIDKENEKATEKYGATIGNKINMDQQYATELAKIDTTIVASEEQKQAKLNEISAAGADQRKRDWESTVTSMLETSAIAVDAISSLYEAQKNRELKAAGDNAEAKEKIEKKYFEKQKKVSIAQALINGAIGVTKAFAQGGILGFITGALITVATLAQVAVIASQTYAKGGFTGKGKGRDKTGEKVAGVVHEDEFVLNKKMTKKYRPLIEAIHKDDPSAIANAIANKNFHAVHDKTAEVLMRQDPYTEKMYEIMRNSPTTYIDSNGNQVLKYPDGRSRIIKQKRPLNYYPSMIK